MAQQRQIRLISAAANLALIFSLLFTSNVRADDPTNPSVSGEAVITSEEEPIDAPTVSELLGEFPDNIDLVVSVDDQIVPLVTTEAAAAVLLGDPIWCPEGVSPIPLANGCTDSYADLESLITDFDDSTLAEPDANGTIWIMSGTDSSTFDVVIDGSIHAQWSNHTLTLQGGWDGTPSGNVNGISNFSVPISIINWNNTVELGNIGVFNTDAAGLEVETSGDIVLENITSENNSDDGADLFSSAGDITISGMNSFVNNGGVGLYLETNGNVQVENLTSSGNDGIGAEIYSSGSVTISGSNWFVNNGDSGLYAESDNTIAIDSITVANNGGNGLELYSNNGIILDGASHFSGNDDSGLYAETNGSFQVNDVTAEGNGGGGADIFAIGDVTIDGTNSFIGNGDSGLYVEAGGDIQASSLAASNNGGYGAEIYAGGEVALFGTNFFSGNGESGLYVESEGDVDAGNVTANANSGSGTEIQAFGTVNVGGTNIFTNNFFDGLFIDTEDNIYVSNINSHNNGLSGTYLETSGSAVITCGYLSNNAGYEIEADVSGSLVLNGVDFGGDIDGEIGSDEDNLVLNSNSCFIYPGPPSNLNDDVGEADVESDSLPIHVVFEGVGGSVILDCNAYRGTLIFTRHGDGAYIPCPFVDTALLLEMAENDLPFGLTQGDSFISGLYLTIFDDERNVVPVNLPGSIWYTSPNSESGMRVVYWDGREWVEYSDQIAPFMNIFFMLPHDVEVDDLAILYWNGSQWMELSESGHLGNGYIVKEGGHISDDGLYFEAAVNFTGMFVLAQK